MKRWLLLLAVAASAINANPALARVDASADARAYAQDMEEVGQAIDANTVKAMGLMGPHGVKCEDGLRKALGVGGDAEIVNFDSAVEGV